MAYSKKNRMGTKFVNKNPWTRESQSPRSSRRVVSPKVNTNALNLSFVLTGRKPPLGRKSSPMNPMNVGSNRYMPASQKPKGQENRGGSRRAPFLSNTGPGRKTKY
jgi:hypothetical protein